MENDIPAGGAKDLPTNFTLMSFLEIHIKASEENSEEVEAYINRFNMSRCTSCGERSNDVNSFELCVGCMKSHTDKLKHDLKKLTVQIKRLSIRLTESVSNITKTIEGTKSNCKVEKQGIHDYVEKHIAEIRKKEANFVSEINIFESTELSLLNCLKSAIELEKYNIDDSCQFIDDVIEGKTETEYSNLLHLKKQFADGIIYLRNFQPDIDEFFGKKIRFSVGDDASKLAVAISNWGEIGLAIPGQFASRYLKIAEHYVSKPFRLSIENDCVKNSKRAQEIEERTIENLPYSRMSMRKSPPLDDFGSRYGRSRLTYGSHNAYENGRSSPGPTSSNHMLGSNPWSKLSDVILDPTINKETKASTKKEVPTKTSVKKEVETKPSVKNEVETKKTKEVLSKKRDIEKKDTCTESNLLPQIVAVSPSELIKKEITRRKSTDTQKPSAPVIVNTHTSSHNTSTDATNNDEGDTSPGSSHSPPVLKKEDSKSGEDSDNPNARASLVERASPLPCAVDFNIGSSDSSSATDIDSDVARNSNHEKPPHSSSKSSQILSVNNFKTSGSSIGEVPSWIARRKHRDHGSRTQSNPNPDDIKAALALAKTFESPSNSKSNLTREGSPGSSRVQQLLKERADRLASVEYKCDVGESSNERRSRGTRDRTPSLERSKNKSGKIGRINSFSCNIIDYESKGIPLFCIKKNEKVQCAKGVSGTPGREFVVVDASGIISMYTKEGRFINSFGSCGKNPEQFDQAMGVAFNRSKYEIIISDAGSNNIKIFDITGKLIRVFGRYGSGNGEFNQPWGVHVDEMGFIFVCDKGNHRVQIFDHVGNFIRIIGTGKGSGPTQFNHPLYVAVHKRSQNIYVSDSSNHRISIFENTGIPLFSFGTEGYSLGSLQIPKGLAVDDQGFVVVADSGNRRVQIFANDGSFFAAFGTFGNNPGQFKSIEDLTILNGNIIVTDSTNGVQIF
uniref:B box-type domain-containing protein n=1 Tax=Rhabditophanes sp. KR3021 TaxID=114890 RepID=A0AC35UD02_9BILA